MTNTLYDRIGAGYNSTRKADPFIIERLYAHLQPSPGGRYLDIGCGTGDYTIALKEKAVDICGSDPSELMLEVAGGRSSEISWVAGRAEHLPFQDECFDGVCGVLTLHHWTDLPGAFREIHRALKTGGRAVFFTSTPAQMEQYWLNHYFPEMMRSSISQMPSVEQLTSAATNAGLRPAVTEPYFVTPQLTDYFLYAGKYRPQLYLDKKVRKGISSFAAQGLTAEVNIGLAKLDKDISSQKFYDIQQSFDNTLGDYLFAVYEK